MYLKIMLIVFVIFIDGIIFLGHYASLDNMEIQFHNCSLVSRAPLQVILQWLSLSGHRAENYNAI